MADPEKPAWETLTNGDLETTDRLKVPGGHLYRTTVYQEHDDGDHDWYEAKSTALCFVPDHPYTPETPR